MDHRQEEPGLEPTTASLSKTTALPSPQVLHGNTISFPVGSTQNGPSLHLRMGPVLLMHGVISGLADHKGPFPPQGPQGLQPPETLPH